MQLYERNYFELTAKEKSIVKKIEGKKTIGLKALLSLPHAYFFNSSYFPNNMLDVHELKSERTISLIKEFRKVIRRPDVTEREVLNFIKENRAYFLVASILRNYDFGHHGAYLFPEFPLSNNFVVDFLVIGKNSGGHEFIFVELESVYGSVTKQDGTIGESIRRGLKQVEEWEFWLEKNFRNLNSTLDKYRNKNENLPTEYFEFDQSRIHFAVVSGRRENYSEPTYRKRRKLLKESGIRLMHYDNLIDCAKGVCKSKNWV
jgi:hypothetical protein